MATIRCTRAFAVAFLTVVAVAAPTVVETRWPQPDRDGRREVGRQAARGEIFRIGTPVRVGPGERVDGSVVVIGAPITVRGEVTGDVVAFGAPIVIEGEVGESVVAIGGFTRLGSEAVVVGDIVTIGGPLRRARGASVQGDVVDMGDLNIDLSGLRPDIWPFASTRSRLARTWDLAGTVVRVLFLALLAAMAFLGTRGMVERVAERAASEPLKAGLVGFLAQMLLVPVSILTVILLLISIIGIPLLLLAPFVILALVCVSIVGFTGVALGVGRSARSRMGAFGPASYTTVWAGIVLLVVPTIMGEALEVAGGLFRALGFMFLLTGLLIEYAAWTAGLGALILNGLGAPVTRRPGPSAPAAPPPEPRSPAAPPPPESPPSSTPLPG